MWMRKSSRLTPLSMADRARDRGEWAVAAEHYRAVLRLDLFDTPIWVQLGHALKESGRLAEAERAYRIALEDDAGNADTYLQLGHSLKLQGKTREMRDAYLQAMALDPASAASKAEIEAMGAGEVEWRWLEKPATDERARKRLRKSSITIGDRATFVHDWATAAAAYGKALRRSPERAAIWVQCGHAHRELRHYAKAEESYSRATLADPNCADAFLHLAHALNRRGEDIKARAAHRKAIELDPTLPRIAALDDGMPGQGGLGSEGVRTGHSGASGKDEALPELQSRMKELGFDPVWYLKRNVDVAKAGVDPFAHYLEHGMAGGRAPNASKEPGTSWSARFDPDWYLARNPDVVAMGADPLEHFLEVGLLEDRAPNAKEESREGWRDRFDPAWYLQRNEDVARSKGDPLEHFIQYGLRERRKPNASATLASEPVTAAALEVVKAPSLGAESVLFISHSPDGRLKGHALHHIDSLRANGLAVILIVAADRPFVDGTPALLDRVDGLLLRENKGFDFAAWAHVLRQYPALLDCSTLFLVNDSVIGPSSARAMADLIRHVRLSGSGLLGLTENIERGWHLQSYFLACKAPLLKSESFRTFMADIVSYSDKNDVVNEYETRLASAMQAAGHTCEAVYPTPDAINPTLWQWRSLLKRGYPYLKVAMLRDSHAGLDRSDWRQVMSAHGYDVRLADQTLATLAAHTRFPAGTLRAAKRNLRQEALAGLHGFFAEGRTIRFPVAAEPTVSVLLVLWNEAELSLRCLQSLASTIDVPMELIIVDNASSDDTAYLLDRLEGVRIVRNLEDLHFLRAANQAAARARGRTLLLINNDACLEPGAVQFGLETIDGADDIGAVGGKLILPDGSLQEAGSIIWSDGSCLGVGRGERPDKAEYNFRREVDYCSGAYMLLRRDLFEQLERFDSAYAPAYYEETDLCMRIRRAGYRIMYDPRVEVRHYEFASSATPGEASTMMRRNLQLFRTRNASALARHHLAPGQPVVLARMTDRWRPRVLVVEDLLPFGSFGSGFPRTARIVAALHRLGCFVTYYSVMQSSFDLSELQASSLLDIEFVLGADRLPLAEFIDSRAGAYQLMMICRPDNMMRFEEHFLARPASYRGAAIVYDAEAVVSPREAARLALAGSPLSVAAERDALAKELGLTRFADAVMAVNEHEAGLFRDSGSTNVHVVGNAIEPQPTPSPFDNRHDFLFVGAMGDDKMPNVDSLMWFIEEVMPILDTMIGQRYRVFAAGPLGARKLQKLVNPRVVLLNRVPDLSGHYDWSRVFIAPTRYAAGIPLKIHEAAARGIPCVVTRLLARQLGWRDGEHLLVADSAQAFAEACRRLYTDEGLWTSIRAAALARVTSDADPEVFDERVKGLLETVKIYPAGRSPVAARIALPQQASQAERPRKAEGAFVYAAAGDD